MQVTFFIPMERTLQVFVFGGFTHSEDLFRCWATIQRLELESPHGSGSSISGVMMNYQPKQCTIFKGNPPNLLYMCIKFDSRKMGPI